MQRSAVGYWIPCLSLRTPVGGHFLMRHAILVRVSRVPVPCRGLADMLPGTNYPNVTGNAAAHNQGVERKLGSLLMKISQLIYIRIGEYADHDLGACESDGRWQPYRALRTSLSYGSHRETNTKMIAVCAPEEMGGLPR